MDRYEGRPLVRLLEWYVLDAIGQLHEFDQERLRRMTPHLARTFGKSGTWQEIVHAELEFPTNLPEKIREKWEGFLASAHALGMPVVPEEYAQAFVDQNFSGIESARKLA